MKFNRRGISAVVATVLIILITVAAVTIIWAAIIPLITENIENTQACLTAQTEVVVQSDFTCISTNGSAEDHYVDLQIKAGPSDVGLSDIQVILYAGGNTNSTTTSDTSYNFVNESRTLPGSNSAKVYRISNVSNLLTGTVTDVQIAPIVTEGQSDQICNPGTVLALKACP